MVQGDAGFESRSWLKHNGDDDIRIAVGRNDDSVQGAKTYHVGGDAVVELLHPWVEVGSARKGRRSGGSAADDLGADSQQPEGMQSNLMGVSRVFFAQCRQLWGVRLIWVGAWDGSR